MKANPIRATAVACVAATSIFIMVMAYRTNDVLAGPDWCRTALGAGKISGTNGVVTGLDACVSLLTIQLNSLSMNSHILIGVVALCLLVLIVIVVAGAKLELNASATGVQANMSSTDAPAAAQAVADTAQQTADVIKDGAAQ
jgi:hypothetical protein